MDEIINKNKQLLKNLTNINNNLSIDDQLVNLLNIKNEILNFDNQYKQLQELMNICKDINQQNKKLFNHSILKIKNKINNNNINIKNEENNNRYIDYQSIIPENIEKTYDNILKIPVIYVNSETDIQNSPLYYVKKTKQFGIKINNNLILGNIGNTYNKKDKKSKVKRCKKIFCNKSDCYYFHNNDRNFMNYAWTHSTSYKIPKTKKINGIYQIINNDIYNTRLLGSRDTLINDLLYSNINEKELRQSQLMHDILIYQVLTNYLNNI